MMQSFFNRKPILSTFHLGQHFKSQIIDGYKKKKRKEEQRKLDKPIHSPSSNENQSFSNQSTLNIFYWIPLTTGRVIEKAIYQTRKKKRKKSKKKKEEGKNKLIAKRNP